MAPVADIIVDYQNIHLTGHGQYCPGGEAKHLCLIHPLHYANQLLQHRNLIRRLIAERRSELFEPATLGEVVAFRGQPSNVRDSSGYRRSQAQRAEWTRDRRVRVVYRTLKYYTSGEVREKGIDVLVALEFVQKAAQASRDADRVVILAAHDTDQEPAIELAYQLAPGQIETAGWRGCNVLRTGGNRVWNTVLDEQHFCRARDPKDYT